MNVVLRVTLLMGLVLGGFPHVFCRCGCADAAAEPVAPPACHACCGGLAQPESEKPKPCRCRTCEVVKAVADSPSTSVPALHVTWQVPPAAAAASVRLVSADSPESFDPAKLCGPFAHLGCALTVFLGRLLL